LADDVSGAIRGLKPHENQTSSGRPFDIARLADCQLGSAICARRPCSLQRVPRRSEIGAARPHPPALGGSRKPSGNVPQRTSRGRTWPTLKPGAMSLAARPGVAQRILASIKNGMFILSGCASMYRMTINVICWTEKTSEIV